MYHLSFFLSFLGESKKGVNPFIHQAMGLIAPLLFFYKDSFDIK